MEIVEKGQWSPSAEDTLPLSILLKYTEKSSTFVDTQLLSEMLIEPTQRFTGWLKLKEQIAHQQAKEKEEFVCIM